MRLTQVYFALLGISLTSMSWCAASALAVPHDAGFKARGLKEASPRVVRSYNYAPAYTTDMRVDNVRRSYSYVPAPVGSTGRYGPCEQHYHAPPPPGAYDSPPPVPPAPAGSEPPARVSPSDLPPDAPAPQASAPRSPALRSYSYQPAYEPSYQPAGTGMRIYNRPRQGTTRTQGGNYQQKALLY